MWPEVAAFATKLSAHTHTHNTILQSTSAIENARTTVIVPAKPTKGLTTQQQKKNEEKRTAYTDR